MSAEKKPRKSLVAGLARKDRFGERRPRDDARKAASRDVLLKKSSVDATGFDDVDAAFDTTGGGDASDEPDFSYVQDDGDEDPSKDALVTGRSSKRKRRSTSEFWKTGATTDENGGDNTNSASREKRKRTPASAFWKTKTTDTRVKKADKDEVASDEDDDDDDDDNDDDKDEDENEEEEEEEEEDAGGAKKKRKKLSFAADVNINDDVDDQIAPASNTMSVSKSSKTKSNPRRQTLKMVAEARALGLVDVSDGGTDGSSTTESGGRRSGRKKLRPLQFWKNERVKLTRADSRGMGNILPVMDLNEPVVIDGPVDNRPSPTKAFRRTTPKARVKGKKTKEKSTAKKGADGKVGTGDGDSDDDTSTAKREPLTSTGWVFDSSNKSDRFAVVCKSEEQVQMEILHQALPAGTASIADAERPRGGKTFEEAGFSAGILELPPHAIKFKELAQNTEVFYVADAPVNGLEVCIHNMRVVLSKGDNFFIPKQNVYHLRNLSASRSVKLYFTLIKAD